MRERPVRIALRRVAVTLRRGLCLALLLVGGLLHTATAADDLIPAQRIPLVSGAPVPVVVTASTADAKVIVIQPAGTMVAKHANFIHEAASPEARHIADWVVDSADNRRLPFAIVDKTQARVFVFDARGQLLGTAPALLGLAIGDDSAPGIGTRPMAGIRPEERTTPAGRFVVAMDHNANGKDILWVDYENAISMHAVIAGTAADRRTQRLATPSTLDNRISFGCINVPARFFKQVVQATFTGTEGIVYVLPETRSAKNVFSSYDVEEHALAKNAGNPGTTAGAQKVNAILTAESTLVRPVALRMRLSQP